MLQAVYPPKNTEGQSLRRVTPTRRTGTPAAVIPAAAPTPAPTTPASVTDKPRRKRHYTPRARTCPICSERFTPARKSARFCSPACKQKAYRRRAARRKPPAPPAAPALEASTCAHCQRGYFADRAHPSLYCSTRCKNASWRMRRAAAVDTVAAVLRQAGKPCDDAADIVEFAGLAQITESLAALGWRYDYSSRSFCAEAG